jgi:hypothetical protein
MGAANAFLNLSTTRTKGADLDYVPPNVWPGIST